MAIRRQQGERPEKGIPWNQKTKIATHTFAHFSPWWDTLGLWERPQAPLSVERGLLHPRAAFGLSEMPRFMMSAFL